VCQLIRIHTHLLPAVCHFLHLDPFDIPLYQHPPARVQEFQPFQDGPACTRTAWELHSSTGTPIPSCWRLHRSARRHVLHQAGHHSCARRRLQPCVPSTWIQIYRPESSRKHLRLLRVNFGPVQGELQLQHEHVRDLHTAVYAHGRFCAIALPPQVSSYLLVGCGLARKRALAASKPAAPQWPAYQAARPQPAARWFGRRRGLTAGPAADRKGAWRPM
jgi:hypothetical protein